MKEEQDVSNLSCFMLCTQCYNKQWNCCKQVMAKPLPQMDMLLCAYSPSHMARYSRMSFWPKKFSLAWAIYWYYISNNNKDLLPTSYIPMHWQEYNITFIQHKIRPRCKYDTASADPNVRSCGDVSHQLLSSPTVLASQRSRMWSSQVAEHWNQV